MADFKYGPVEFMLIGFAGARPGPELVGAILNLIESDTAKLLDMVFASRSAEGALTVLELEEVADEFGLAGLEIDELGLAGADDIEEFADQIAPGTSAALLVVEHVWAREFAAALYRAGGAVLYSQRIPAPAVNELVGSLGN